MGRGEKEGGKDPKGFSVSPVKHWGKALAVHIKKVFWVFLDAKLSFLMPPIFRFIRCQLSLQASYFGLLLFFLWGKVVERRRGGELSRVSFFSFGLCLRKGVEERGTFHMFLSFRISFYHFFTSFINANKLGK